MKFLDIKLFSVRLILALMLATAIFFGWQSFKLQIASTIAEYTSPFSPDAKIKAEYAFWLSPNDPSVRWFFATVNKDLPSKERARLYEDVVRAAPYDFRWWIELARAREQADEISEAEQAIKQTISIAPSYVYPRWQAGNFYLRSGEIQKAIEEFKKALHHNTIYRQQIFSVLWDFFEKDPKVLEEIVSEIPSAQVDLALFFAAKNLPEESLKIWRQLDEREKKDRQQTASVIAQGLFDKRFFRTALEFSKEIGFDTNAGLEKITNGGFELPVKRESEAYFDWKIIAAAKTEFNLDPANKKEGNRSLRIQFNGYNGTQFYHFYQTVAVQPSTKYILSFWYRAEKIRTVGPPIIEIINANDDKPIKSSQPLVDTNEWRLMEMNFVTPDNAEGIIIRVGRVVCGEQCPIFGTIWLDDFQLKRS
ncbi:MAG: hypothetical protein D6735_04470 [Acidobacteria bacterium]|nr:MAG: hypothetical protein D6735_04470 [Acidobacteriota bacterium]